MNKMNLIFRVGYVALACSVSAICAEQAEQVVASQKMSTFDIINKVTQLTSDASILPPHLQEMRENAKSSGGQLSEEFLEKFVSTTLAWSTPKADQKLVASLSAVQEELVKVLKGYRASGVSFAIDPNVGLIWDNQNPDFTVVYADAQGRAKNRKYAASIDMVGLKLEASIRFNAIFFVGTDFDFYESNKEIELGTGVELFVLDTLARLFLHQPRVMSLEDLRRPDVSQYLAIQRFFGLFGFTYVPFKNTAGGMIILSFCPGITSNFISVVTGGTLKPVDPVTK